MSRARNASGPRPSRRHAAASQARRGTAPAGGGALALAGAGGADAAGRWPGQPCSAHDDDHPADGRPWSAAAGSCPSPRPPDAASSTWYCAGGTATGTKDGVAEQTDRDRQRVRPAASRPGSPPCPSEGDAAVERWTCRPTAGADQSSCCRRWSWPPTRPAVVEVRRRRGRGVPRARRARPARPPRPARRRPRSRGTSPRATARRPRPPASCWPCSTRSRARPSSRSPSTPTTAPGRPQKFAAIVVPGNRSPCSTCPPWSRCAPRSPPPSRCARAGSSPTRSSRRRHAGHGQARWPSPPARPRPGRRGGSPTARPAQGDQTIDRGAEPVGPRRRRRAADPARRRRHQRRRSTPFELTVPAGRPVRRYVSADGRVPPGSATPRWPSSTDGIAHRGRPGHGDAAGRLTGGMTVTHGLAGAGARLAGAGGRPAPSPAAPPSWSPTRRRPTRSPLPCRAWPTAPRPRARRRPASRSRRAAGPAFAVPVRPARR